MKNSIEIIELNNLTRQDLQIINGGGPLREAGIEFGEKMTGALIWVGLALITKKWF